MKKLLTQVGFTKDDNQPFVRFSEGDQISLRELTFGEKINWQFDKSTRHCTGWFNPNTGENHVCPTKETVEPKYEQCKDCMAKTGFNPSFYNADSISTAQAEYNTNPHILYLAYFSPNDVKIGISHAGRNLSRLLEQGARLAYVLETFPSANIARHYEGQIGRFDGIIENVKLGRKMELLTQDFDAALAEKVLQAKKAEIEDRLQSKFENYKLVETEKYFLAPDFNRDDLHHAVSVEDQAQISGEFVGMIGQIILCRQSDNLLALPLKKLTGYFFDEPSETIEIEVAPAQFSLF